uniref:PRA1 family protein n=1 Tax=Ditylenchus dipsaci TaxID=166011 RepID=A0A915DWB9_9BILA
MSSASADIKNNLPSVKENLIISDSLQFAPFRSLDEFLLKARFQKPQFEMKKWNNRIVQNLLYFQTNYFLLFFALFSLVSFFQFSEVMLGISAVGISAGVALFAFTSHDQIKQFRGNHPYVVLATIVLCGYYAISQLASVLSLILSLIIPAFVVLLHSSFRLRELSTKVNYHLENAKLRNTVMFSFLQSMGLHERA